MKTMSLINPSRDNLKYLKWSYKSVRKNAAKNIEYCVASDYSTDGTVEWCEKIAKNDPYFKFIVNDGTWFGENKGNLSRMGHTLLYDKLISEVATNDIIMIWHSDMYLTPNSIEKVLELIQPKTVVSMTRIEPPLHPPGAEKLLFDFGIEPEQFKENDLLTYVKTKQLKFVDIQSQGMFAPWAIYKKDFLAIGGHDPLYAPQSREDSDIFNRFILSGYKSIQTWEAFVYHMTCRGSRYNPKLTVPGTESTEWLIHNKKSERNFTRKWGHMISVDENLKPIIPHKYDITFIVHSGTYKLLEMLEPWCSKIYITLDKQSIQAYIKSEQSKTLYDLSKRVFEFKHSLVLTPKTGTLTLGGVILEFDGEKLTQHYFNEVVTQLSKILDQGVSNYENYDYGIFKITTNSVKTYEKELIYCDKTKIVR